MNSVHADAPRRKQRVELVLDPLPSELHFEGMNDFVLAIEPGFGTDDDYIQTKLLPYFESARESLTSAIREHELLLSELESSLKQPPLSMNDVDSYRTIWTLSLYRRLRIVFQLYLAQSSSLLMTRIMLVKQKLALLQHLLAVANELIQRPRYVYLNTAHACHSPKTVEFQLIPELFWQVEALRKSVLCILAQTKLVPKPFPSKSSNVALLRRVVKASLLLRDPETEYMPYTEEYELFAQFLLSKASPVQFATLKIVKNSDFVVTLSSAAKELHAYAGYNATDIKEMEVLQLMCSRFLFDMLAVEERTKGSDILQTHLDILAGKTIAEIGVDKRYIPGDWLEKKPSDVFSTNTAIASAIDDLLICHFLTDPIDVLFHIKRIELKLLAAISEQHGETLAVAKTFDGLFIFWKLLFIAAQIPEPRQIFDFVSKWKVLPFIPNTFLSAYKIPKLVLKTLLNEALLSVNK